MPLYDSYGELLVVTTRDIREERPVTVILSPYWHESYVKAHHLFGLNVAKGDIIARGAVVVVEGQFDVAYLRSIGIRHVVGMLGHAVSFRQISLLSRYCSKVYLFFDGDKAGRDATTKTMKMGYEHCLSDPNIGIDLIPIETPWGKDPDEFTLTEVVSLCRKAKDATLQH
jgi:DNA primase